MRKEKFKRKSQKVFFSPRFILLMCIVIIVFTSSAYAIFTESLTITGTVTGQITYTYYFEKPSDWSTVNAYLWVEPSTSYSAWPGTAMTATGNNSTRGLPIYKIEIKPGEANYRQYEKIIFNNGNNIQTVNISLTAQNNNQLYYFPTTGTRRLIFYTKNGEHGSQTYAYVWKQGGSALAGWPGTDVTSTYNSSNKTYYMDVTHDYNYFIVNRGSGQWQSGDVPICNYGIQMRLINYTYWTDFVGTWENYGSFPSAVNLTPSHPSH